uniref:Uncharacterized protein n=1 Tax=Cajanus cajan TaxID=3821 RepID=A0A151UAZ7_CAJCA|nr:hypothetical protein KK1_020696 [Cajanus cajan]
MSWFLVLLFLSLTFGAIQSESSHDKMPPSAVVVGTVYCDTCFQQDFSMGSHYISGASVAVECKDGYGSSKPRFRKEVKTDEHGEFKVQLPFSVSKHVKRIKGCTVKLISSSEPYCAVASAATSSSLRLKSRKQGLHIFSAGFFSFKPLKQPNLCNQKPSTENIKGLDDVKKQKIADPNNLIFPPNPLFPPPIVPNPFQPPPLVPNPLQPPPVIPNPLQPPGPSPLVPNPFQPPSSGTSPPLFPFPTEPGSTPSSSPPAFPFPFPPLFPPPSSPDTPSTSSKNASP